MKMRILVLIIFCFFLYVTGCQSEGNKSQSIIDNAKVTSKEATTSVNLPTLGKEILNNRIFEGIVKYKRISDAPEDVVYVFNEKSKWSDFKMKYFKDIKIPNIEIDDYNKSLLCFIGGSAIPYKLPILVIEGIYKNQDKITVKQNFTGVVEDWGNENYVNYAIQVIIVTVSRQDIPDNIPINIDVNK